MDSQPLRAKDRELVPLLCHVIREMAEFVRCEPRDLFLTNNVTYGVNTVLQSLIFKPGDIIATLNVGYGECVNWYQNALTLLVLRSFVLATNCTHNFLNCELLPQ